MKRNLRLNKSIPRRITALIAAPLLLAVLACPAHAQRFGDGHVLRRIFRVEEAIEPEPAIPEKPGKPDLAPTKKPATKPAAKPAYAQPAYRSGYGNRAYPKSSALSQPNTATRSTTATRPSQRTPNPLPLPPQSNTRASQYGVKTPSRSRYATPSTQRPNPYPYPRTQQDAYSTKSKSTNPKRRTSKATPAPRKTEHVRLDPRQQPDLDVRAARKVVEHEAFGVTVKMRSSDIVVTKVKKSGTAASAGIQVGDALISVGEIPLLVAADIEQLDDVLKAGDQVEFELRRKGKPQKLLVSFEKETSYDSEPATINDENLAELRDSKTDDNGDFASPLESRLSNDANDPQPTPAVRNAWSMGDDNDDAMTQVTELQQRVRSQEELIARLQQRLRQLENADGETSPAPQSTLPTPANAEDKMPLLILQ